MPHQGAVNNTMTGQFPLEETLRDEEKGRKFFNEMGTTMNEPVTCVGDKEELRMQQGYYTSRVLFTLLYDNE